MATIIDSCEEQAGEYVETEVVAYAAPVTFARANTTLYDLIAAIQDTVDPGDDARVIATVVRLLSAGYIILPNTMERKSSESEGAPAMPL
jgi:hypothetical protein